MSYRIACCACMLSLFTLITPTAWSQTWVVDPAGSSVQLDADTLADDDTVPGVTVDLQTDGTFQTPFVDLLGNGFTIGENVSSQANEGAVRSSAASVVKANDGTSFSLEWRAATDLEMRGDILYVGTGHTTLKASLDVQLTGLIPGQTYKIRYDYLVASIAVEDHEALIEDPELAASAMDFTFGTAAIQAFQTNAGASGGFANFETVAGSGSYLLLAGAAPVNLSVNLNALADARFTNPPINGSPPEDGAGSEGFGRLTFTAELIPEPASAVLLLALVASIAIRYRISRAEPFGT